MVDSTGCRDSWWMIITKAGIHQMITNQHWNRIASHHDNSDVYNHPGVSRRCFCFFEHLHKMGRWRIFLIFYLLWDEQKYICEQTRNEPRNPGQRPQKKNFRLPGEGSGAGRGAWSFSPETGIRNRVNLVNNRTNIRLWFFPKMSYHLKTNMFLRN